MRPCIIFDADGTLCDVSEIRYLLRQPKGKKDFEKFHALSIDCPPIDWVKKEFLKWKRDGFVVIIVTARQEKWLHLTLLWAQENGLRPDGIYMRKNGDFRPDYEIKSDILKEIRRDGLTPIQAYDDNPAIIKMWEEHGIPCVIVPGWDVELTETEGAPAGTFTA